MLHFKKHKAYPYMTNYYFLLIQFFVALVALFLLWKTVQHFRRKARYKRIAGMAFPSTYQDILTPLRQYQALSPTQKEKIHFLILLFVEQKEFIAAKMNIDDKVKVIVAFYACLMRLGFEVGEKDHVQTIIVYPKHFIVHDNTNNGIHNNKSVVLEGQSSNGTVVISWQDIEANIAKEDKDNVIIHEFAHELDFEDGLADGTPLLENSNYKRWSKVFSKAFDTLSTLKEEHESSEALKHLGYYALTNEAEFFAVCSERFFETPKTFKRHFPDVYEELKGFYRLDAEVLFAR